MKKKPRDPFTDPFCRAEDLGLAIPDSARQDLLALTPGSYTGKAAALAKRIAKG